MENVVYGIWNDEVYDFRNKNGTPDKSPPELVGLDELAPGGKVRALIADRGFLVFDKTISLSRVFQTYIARAADESCGKCTPCRIGTVQLAKMLSSKQQYTEDEIEQMRDLAAHIGSSSLCGLGKSCCRALSGALNAFADEINKPFNSNIAALTCSTYVTAPCIEACPAHVDIPRYVDYINDDRPLHAFSVLTENYPEVASCGRVCVRYCEDACRRRYAEGAVSIKALKRYAADNANHRLDELFTPDLIQKTDVSGKRVAIIGAGPAGVTCAYHLLRNGIEVDIYESQPLSGGMLVAGIPSYRLPKEIVKHETQDIIAEMGGHFHFNQALGKDFSLDDLKKQGFDAIFVAIGAGQANSLGKNDDELSEGFFTGISYLWHSYCLQEEGITHESDEDVVVVGGGNVAMDCVRTALRFGAKNVHLVYRRSQDDMSAHHEEVEAGQIEGIQFHFMSNPVEVLHDQGRVTGMRMVRMRKKEGDPRAMEEIPGSDFIIPCGKVIASIGQKVDRDLLEHENIKTDRWGCIEVDEDSMESSISGTFAGGDCVLGPKTMIEAMAQGEKAAKNIRAYLRGQTRERPLSDRMHRFLKANRLMENEMVRRQLLPMERTKVQEIDLHERKGSFNEVELVMTREEAFHESERCLRCYRMYSVVTETPL